MKLRAIIVDDEFTGINSLHILLERHCPEVKSVAETKSASTAIELIENYLPDIVFLDINMPEMNGFELLDKLKWKNFNLIFSTAHQEYALRALKANAIDYLLKPIDPEELKSAIRRVVDKKLHTQNFSNDESYLNLLNSLKNNTHQKIIVHSKNGVEAIETTEIVSLEAKSNYTQINLINSKCILSSKTLKEFEEQLCSQGSNFMRVHNSFIINLTKVSRYLKFAENIVMVDAQTIPISKSRKDHFYEWLSV